MESGIKIIFRLRFNDNIISKKFHPTQNLKTVISKARELFSWPDEDIYTIFVDGKEQDEELILSNLSLQKDQSLDFVKKVAPPNDLVTFSVSKDNKGTKCSGSLSKSIGEALKECFDSEDFNLSHYQLFINGEEMEETKILSDIENIEDIVVALVRKMNSAASDSEDGADQEDEGEEKEIIFEVNNDEVSISPLFINWFAPVKLLKIQVAEKLSIPIERCLQVWLVNEKELDDSQQLNKQIISPEVAIQVEIRHILLVQIDLKGEKIEKMIAINLSTAIKSLKIKLEKEIQMSGTDQAWYLENREEQLRDGAKLCEYIRDDYSPKPRILIKKHLNQRIFHENFKAMKTYFFKYQSRSVTRDFPNDESIATVLTTLKHRLNLKSDIQIQCKYGQVVMDPSKHLSDYMEEPDDVIVLEEIENPECSLKINIIFQRRPFCILAKNSALVEDIKQQACMIKSIENLHLFSLKLDNNILKSSCPLTSIPDFTEDSFLDLCAEIEINVNFFKNQQPESFSLCIDSNIKIEDLKKKIQANQLITYQEFDLILYSQHLDENKPLSQYLEREGSWVITVEERLVEKSSFKVTFNKIPENQIYSVNVFQDEVFHNLTPLLSKEFRIDSSLQVWKHEGKMIFDQQGWSDFLNKFKDANEINFDVFECVRPFEQTVFFNRMQKKQFSKERVKLNLLELVSVLKKEVASIWQLQENQIQVWKVNSREVRDDLPLAVQYNVSEREDVDVVISTPRELILIFNGVESQKSFDGDATIFDLKKHLFELKILEIKPESQVWSFEYDQIAALEDDQELSFYLNHSQSKRVVVRKRARLIRFQYHNPMSNELENVEIEGDIESDIKTLKQRIVTKLALPSHAQFWMLDEKEMADHIPLQEYVSLDELNSVLIDLYPIKDFILLVPEKSATIKIPLPLIAKVSKIIDIMIETYPIYRSSKIFLQVHERILDENKSLQDYLDVWASISMPIIRATKAKKLTITLKEVQKDFYFGSQTTVQSLESEMCQRFSLQNHEFSFLENGKHFSKQDLLQLFKNEEDKALTVIKMKKCTFIFEDLPGNKEEIWKRNSETYLDEIEQQIQEQFKIPNQNLKFFYNNQQVCIKNRRSTLDEIDSESYELNFTVQMIKVLEIQHSSEKYLVEYIPSETIGDIKLKLKEQGFLDVMKFSLQKDKRVLPDKSTLDLNGIVSGRHILIAKMNLQVIVLTDEGEFNYICGNGLQTVAELKQKIKENIEIDVTKQILILLEEQQWVKRLMKDEEMLEELAAKGETTIRILCKPMKKLPIAIGLQKTVGDFQGIFNSSIEEQKKLIELDYKISVNNQIWTIKKDKEFKPMDEETIEEYFRNEVFNKMNPIRIFRRINLSVCLIDKTEVLENLPTYETIRNQKDRIALRLKVLTQKQHWSYNEEELTDSRTLEECFKKKSDIQSAPESESFPLDLIILSDLEYFGFTDKNDINVNLFTSFFLESDEDLNRIVASVNFARKDGSFQFRNKVLGLFFGTLKKHSLWEGLIVRIKKKMFDIKGVNLWASHERRSADQSKFNTQFLLYYFLNSGTPELNIEILKIMRMHFPVPLAIKTWSNRFSVEDTKIVNDLYWIVQKGFVIASFGYGGENSVCGKTKLNNKLLSSNFVTDSERNSICRGCPEILFDIYQNDKFPVNIIDIPSGTEEKLQEKILAYSNMIIVHSFGEEERTREFLDRLQLKIPKIILYRDVQDAFDNITKFKADLTHDFKRALENDIFEVKIVDNPDYENSNELDYLAGKIHEFILEKFQALGEKDKELWKFTQFFDNHSGQVNAVFEKIREKSSQIVQVVPRFAESYTIQRKQMKGIADDQEGPKEDSKEFEGTLLSSELNDVLQLLKSEDLVKQQEETPQLLLEKFQEYLRMMKSQQTMDFYKLYEFKSKFSAKPEHLTEKVIAEFANYWEVVKNQEAYYKEMNFDLLTAKAKGLEFIKECIRIFEQKLSPNIFSIELFWRELIYQQEFLQRMNGQMHERNKSSEVAEPIFSLDFLINFKKKNILKGFPFEIIDGDLLHMPKEFLKNVFKGINDRVIVISVLGPQSSGKSTLLNFLFGCNFVTSSGRCTKGVYGTYFKVSNINSCDGILVLDTEGLFGLSTNKEDQRDKFDRKLVLFCLAMSDIVLINFKGDIDRNLTQVMMVCKDSLKSLQQGNIQKPEMFLILNQNSQTNRETQLQDIDKMDDLGFSSENVKILPLAFDTKREKISTIEKYMDLATKKTPKEDFSEQCRLITQEIFSKINENGNKHVQRTLESAIDGMEHLWELLDKFPDLLRHRNMEDQDQEKKIKEWIEKEVDEGLKRRVSEIAKNLKDSDKIKLDWEKDFRDQFTEEEKPIKLGFTSEFQEGTDIHLFEDLEKVLYTHIERIKIEVENELNIQSHYEKVKVCDSQGLEKIRNAAEKLRNQDKFTEKEKEACFEQVWKEYIEKLEKFYDRERESKNLFQTIIESYKINLHQKAGLPASNFPERDNRSLEIYQNCLQESLIRIYHRNKRFEYTRQSPALIFNAGKSNVSFRYFDLRQYFKKENFCQSLGILKSKIWEIFDVQKIRSHCSKFPSHQACRQNAKESLLNEVDLELKKCALWIRRTVLEDYFVNPPKWEIQELIFGEVMKYEENDFAYETMTSRPCQLKFVDYYQIARQKEEHRSGRMTWKSFLIAVLKNSIKWDVINRAFKNIVKNNFDQVQCQSVVDAIGTDLAQINLEFREVSKFLRSLCYSDEGKIREILNENIAPLTGPFETIDLSTANFKFLKKKVIQSLLQIVDNDYKEFFILKKIIGQRWVVLKDHRNVPWLISYANEDLQRIFQNTMEDKALAAFIAWGFNFKELIDNIFESCISKIKSISSWNSPQIYQEIARETNDLIGIANNDLQQVSCRLDYELVGGVHICIVHLIWKHFEEKHWKLITQPLEEMKNRKEQQKSFFKMVASSDEKQNNKAEAQTARRQIENYLDKLMQNENEKIMKASVDIWKKTTKRSKIQEELDEKYFSKDSGITSDNLYSYIIDPREVILKTYNERCFSLWRNLKRQVKDLEIPFNDCREEVIARIKEIQCTLSRFNEDSWALHNIFEFQQVEIQPQDEVLMKKYHGEITQFYHKIVFALLKGNNEKTFKEYQLTSDLKIAMKKREGLEVSALESKDALKVFEHLENQPGKVTNARIFIDNLLEEMAMIKIKSDELFKLSDGYFRNQSHTFVCKQLCPCCDRICGEEDPSHKIHRCLYGHQIRAIGGAMIPKTKEASTVRCEDISDLDKMKFNGKDMTWGEFKEKMKRQPNNPWGFDDIVKTRNDNELKERFAYAWSLIGEKICKERHKESSMVYVPFNQVNLDPQSEKLKPIHYIFMIDSSGSMIGRPWNDLKNSLKIALGRITVGNKDHNVSLINFAGKVSIEYEKTAASEINVEALGFFRGATNFSRAFTAVFELVEKTKDNDIKLIFMTDGAADYPTEEMRTLKEYLESDSFLNLNIKFSFDAIGFEHGDNDTAKGIIEKFVQDLGGQTHFASNETELTNTYKEILNKNLNVK